NVYKFLRDSDIAERLGRGELVGDIAEVRGTPETLQLRQQNFLQKPQDVYAVVWSAAGGFGDPFDRDPEHVREDVEHRAVSPQAAQSIYGVVLHADGTVDRAATERLR